MSKSYGIIYLAINIQNRKVYVGQTIQSLDTRIKKHFRAARKNVSSHFNNAIRKYGEHNFKFITLGECYSKKELNNAEIECIYFFRSYGSNGEKADNIYGYNITKGGEGTSGFYLSDDIKNKISITINRKLPMKNKSFYECWVHNYGVNVANQLKKQHSKKVGAWRKKNFISGGNPNYRHDITIEKILDLKSKNLSIKQICTILKCSKILINDRIKKYYEQSV